jgi:hypothetical protein
MTAAEPRSKPLLNAYSHTYSLTNGTSNNNNNTYTNAPSIPSPPPKPKTPIIETTNYEDLNGDMYTLRVSSTPPPELPLRQKIVGAWKLESYIAYPTPESPIQRPTFPMTKNVTGFIMYTPDGYLSAQMLIPGQQSFKRGEGEEPQWAEAGKRFFAYCGPYYISDEGAGREEILRHTFQVCNLPGWIGDVQVRTHRFEEDGQVLVLGSEEPTEIKVSFWEKNEYYDAICKLSLLYINYRPTSTQTNTPFFYRAIDASPFSNGEGLVTTQPAHRPHPCPKSRSLVPESRD